MKVALSERGFEFLKHRNYPEGEEARLASQSSAIGNYENSMTQAGSSFLWIGDHHHLNREELQEFVTHLQRWLDTGYLEEQVEK